MINTRARSLTLTTLVTFVLMSENLGAQRAGNWSLCGAGRYDLTMGGQSVGSETFDIACHPGGYTASGRTQLSTAGAATTGRLGARIAMTEEPSSPGGLPTPPRLADGLRPEIAVPPSPGRICSRPLRIRPENWFPRPAPAG